MNNTDIDTPMTGAGLRAWRERLGKDEAWAAAEAERISPRANGGASSVRRVERDNRSDRHMVEALPKALEAEELRQRAQAEPVCPEGVTVEMPPPFDDHVVRLNGVVCFRVRVYKGTASVVPQVTNQTWPARLTRFAADFSEYVTAQHAEGDRQRKLDAVKAAEEALDAASHAEEAACTAYNNAAKARYAAQSTLCNARREAGL